MPVAPVAPIAYVSSPLNRAHDLRLQVQVVGELRARPDACVVRVRSDMIEVTGEKLSIAPEPKTPDEIFLGIAPGGSPWFAAQAREGAELKPLRALMLEGNVPQPELSILAQARSLVHWHERHSFCANCGAKTTMADSGYRRHCSACAADHFPRTDPVVIIAVRHEGHVLLGRQSSWPTGMYSALAGFVEPGETIEQAARREVFEESGIRVGDISYVASQPWPFPSSLMIGLIGAAETTEIKIDTTELEDARWFTPSDIKRMLERQHPEGLTASHPYAIAHLLARTAIGQE